MKNVIALIVVLFAFAKVSFAQEPGIVASDKAGWHKIGEVKADFKTETDGISVMGKDKFKSIKLKITDAPIDISKVIVYYENEKSEEIPAVGMIKAGGETKTYTLKYPNESLKKVVFTYKSEPSYQGDKSHVELFGMK
jgi:hypothetical protein